MDNMVMEKKVFNLDKSNWVLTKLGELADDISKRVDNPAKSGYDRFVGLEHFVSGDVKIKKWGSTDNLTSSTKAFKAGDILFARRNAYLRRASLVDFDGCCSGDAFVLRENHKKVIPGFLAFLMNSNALWDYANSNAAGTMSKRVKWRDLAEYEFLLPPKDQQAQLAELLWAIDEVIEREKEVLEKLNNSYSTLVDNLFSKRNHNWYLVSINKVAKVNSKSLDSKTDPNYEFNYLDLSAIVEPKVIGELKKMKYKDAPSRAKRIVQDDSIILAMVRPYQKAFAYLETATDIISSTGTAVINMNDVAISRFVFHQFFSKRFAKFCEDRMTGTSYPAITPKDVEEYKISIPKNQDLIFEESEKLDKLDFASSTVKSKISSSQSLQKSLINQIF
jgi:type I restriction enzyme S subunit